MTQQSGQYGFDTAVYTLKRTHREQAGVESDIHDYLISVYIIRSRHSRGAILSNLAHLQQFCSLVRHRFGVHVSSSGLAWENELNDKSSRRLICAAACWTTRNSFCSATTLLKGLLSNLQTLTSFKTFVTQRNCGCAVCCTENLLT